MAAGPAAPGFWNPRAGGGVSPATERLSRPWRTRAPMSRRPLTASGGSGGRHSEVLRQRGRHHLPDRPRGGDRPPDADLL